MKSLLVVVTSVALSVSAIAQTGAPSNRYTLEECVRIALQRNFDIQQVYATSRAAAAGLTQAFGQYLPGANVSAN